MRLDRLILLWCTDGTAPWYAKWSRAIVKITGLPWQVYLWQPGQSQPFIVSLSPWLHWRLWIFMTWHWFTGLFKPAWQQILLLLHTPLHSLALYTSSLINTFKTPAQANNLTHPSQHVIRGKTSWRSCKLLKAIAVAGNPCKKVTEMCLWLGLWNTRLFLQSFCHSIWEWFLWSIKKAQEWPRCWCIFNSKMGM